MTERRISLDADCSEQEKISLREIDKQDTDEDIHPEEVNKHVQESIITELRHNQATRFKFILSVCATFAYSMLGWNKGQTGPAFLDILYISDSDLKEGSVFMAAFNAGRAIGSLTGGMLYSKVNRYILLVVGLMIYSLTRALIPWCAFYELMIAVHAIHGFCTGINNVVLMSMAVSIWGATARSRVFISIFMASDPLAGIIAPMITSPFLLPKTSGDVGRNDFWNTSVTTEAYPADHNVGIISTANAILQSNITYIEEPESRVYIAYTFTAALAFLSAIPFIGVYLKQDKLDIKGRINEKAHFIGNLPLSVKRLQLLNIGLFSTVYESVSFAFTRYLHVFCVEHLQWTKTSAAWLMSALFLTLLSGRVFCAYLSHFLKPMILLAFSTLLHVIGLAGLSASGVFLADEGIWISVCAIGIAWSILCPSTWSWTKENLIPLRGKVTAFIMLMGSFGSLSCPLLFGYLMEEISPIWFCFLNLGYSCITVINVILIFLYTRYLRRQSSKDQKNQSLDSA